MEFVGFQRAGHTYAVMLYDRAKNIINNYFIQFSLKDMWKCPHKESRFNNGSWVCGWGFFYFGNIISDDKEEK
jgi:hypothetical protein